MCIRDRYLILWAFPYPVLPYPGFPYLVKPYPDGTYLAGDSYHVIDGEQKKAPVIDYQFGSLRDDFNFPFPSGQV